MSNISNVEMALKDVYDLEGRIDYVVNAAAELMKKSLLSMDYSEIVRILNINYLGVVNTAIASFKYLKVSRGQLLQFASSSYTRGRAYYSLYSSSKAAVVNFVQAIAEEWMNDNVRVNCINPQRTLTPMRIKNFGKEDESSLLKAEKVALESLKTLLSDFSGEIIDVRLD